MKKCICRHTHNIYERILRRKIESQIAKSKDRARFANYREDFETIVSSGVALETVCCADLSFPLLNSAKRNMVKLYMNDVGILSAFYTNTISSRYGTVYRTSISEMCMNALSPCS